MQNIYTSIRFDLPRHSKTSTIQSHSCLYEKKMIQEENGTINYVNWLIFKNQIREPNKKGEGKQKGKKITSFFQIGS